MRKLDGLWDRLGPCWLLVCLLTASPRVAAAATCTWTGAGSTAAWSVAANWDDCGGAHPTPQNGDRLVFPAASHRAASINDLPGLSVSQVLVAGVSVSGDRYVISGNTVVLAGELQFHAPPDASNLGPLFSAPIALGSAATVTNLGASEARVETIDLGGFLLTLTPDAGDLVVSGVMAGAGSLVKTGVRTLVLPSASTFTAPLRIDAGSVRIEHPAALGSAVAGTTVQPGARLIVCDPLAVNEPVILNGGAIATVGGPPLSTGDGVRYVTMPRLTLTADSSLDLAAITALRFTEIEGAFTLTKSGAGALRVDAPNPAFAGRIVVEAGELSFWLITSSLANVDIEATGGSVSGGGPTGTVTVANGWLWPSWRRELATEDLSLGGGATLFIDMFPELGASVYSRVRVTGRVDLSNPILRPFLGGPIAPGTVFVIIDNDGTDPVVGTFAGLPEGTIVTEHNRSFVVSYVGGDGNDVTLTTSARAPSVLSEGATGPFFDTDVAIANPNGPMPVSLTFLTREGRTVVQERTLPAASRTTIHVDGIAGLEGTEVSAVVTSSVDLPLAVERTMFWDGTYYAGHTGSAVQPSQDWLFAEGAQGFFHTYVMLANLDVVPADVSLTFLREGAAPVVRNVTVGPSSRLTIDCLGIEELANTSFGITVHSSRPIVAERAMYFGTTPGRLFSGGHDSAGVTTPAASWLFAEGATGDFFDTFLLLSNPQSTAAVVTIRYLLETGATVTRTKTLPALARLTVNVEAEDDPRLRHAAVSMFVTSDVPIVAERSMYWIGDVAPWTEGHNSFGVNRTGISWLLAEGRIGGPRNFHTYILLANPGERAAEVKVTFLRETGFRIERNYLVPATSRFNIDVNAVSPDLQNESVGAFIQCFNAVEVIAERSMYWDSGGEFFKGGSNATGMRVLP